MSPQQRLFLPALLLIFGNVHVMRLLVNCHVTSGAIIIAVIVFTFSTLGAAFLLAMTAD